MRKMLASLLLTVVLSLVAWAALCTGRPEWILPVNPYAAIPGNTMTFQVALEEPASGTQAVSIGVDDNSLFSSLPSTVYVQNGQTTTTFQATLSTSATGSFIIAASANGEAVDCEVVVQD